MASDFRESLDGFLLDGLEELPYVQSREVTRVSDERPRVYFAALQVQARTPWRPKHGPREPLMGERVACFKKVCEFGIGPDIFDPTRRALIGRSQSFELPRSKVAIAYSRCPLSGGM